MPRHFAPQPTGKTVLEMARARTLECYERFDRVVVLFSGGKDSTACLQLAIEAAGTTSRLPVNVVFYDEEAIPPETVEYMARVGDRPDVQLAWYCIPAEQRNACSRKSPNWWPWALEDQKLWVRPLPDHPSVIVKEPVGFARQTLLLLTPILFPPTCGTVCAIMGIRVQESITRRRAVTSTAGNDAWLKPYGDAKNVLKAYPIYDWNLEDVWLAPNLMGWDYNRAYDQMEAAGLSRNESRCSPPFGEQPIRRLWTYRVCWPELWDKMIARVPGANTAIRYANTELYGLAADGKPDGLTYRDYCASLMERLEPESRAEMAKNIKMLVRQHHRYTDEAMPDEEPHRLSGFNWRDMIPLCLAGGNKFGRQTQKIAMKAMNNRAEMGVPTVPPARRGRK